MSRVGIVVDLPEGNKGVVIFASHEAADRWRDVADDKGIETYGILPVVSRVDALLPG